MQQITNPVAIEYMDTLSSQHKSFYKIGYTFEMEVTKDCTHEAAHQAGLNEVARIEKLRKNIKPEVWVDLTTGRKFKAII